MKLKKGSKEAKAFMAKIRAKKGTAKKVGAYKKPKLFKPTAKQTQAAVKRLVKQSVKKPTTTKKVGSNLKFTPKENRLGASEKDYKTKSKNDLHKDNKSHNVNIKVVSGFNKIGSLNLDIVSKELNKLDTDIKELGYFIRAEKTIKEKNRLKEIRAVKTNQFKALKAYLNSIAKFK